MSGAPVPAGRPSRPPRSSRDDPNRERRGGTAPRGGKPKRNTDPARTVAFETLRAVDERDAYANLILPSLLRRARLHGRDAALATELAYGALRGRGSYDAVLAACTDRPLSEIDPGILDALRLGVHQLISTRIPPHAAVSTTVDLVRATSGLGASKFANAVMRRAAEHDPDTWLESVAPDATTDPDGHLAVLYSHPEWIVRALRDALRTAGRPADELPALLAAHNARPQVALAALPGLTTVEELVEEGARTAPTSSPSHPDPTPPPAGRGAVSAGQVSPVGVLVQGAVDDVVAVREGRARVQDEGSQVVALALAEAPLEGPDGGRWLDLCAGPGGKAALLAAELGERHAAGAVTDDAELVAVEVAQHRADLVGDALAAVPAAFEIRVADGREAAADEPGRYDRVLVDAPCTGLGALRRRPEARWRRTPADLATLAPLQRQLLAAALDAVRPGGVVAYATCSPHPAETRAVVDDVLRSRADVTRIDAPAVLKQIVLTPEKPYGPGPDVQLWIHLHGTDSMYLALLRKNS